MLYVFFFFFFFCQQCVCVLCDSKSSCWRTLTVSVMVIVCQSLGGAAQQAMVCVSVCLRLCVCVHISAGKGRAGPTVYVSTAKSSTPFNPAQRGRVCVFDSAMCVFACLKKNFMSTAAINLVVFCYGHGRNQSRNLSNETRFFGLDRNLNEFFFRPCHVAFCQVVSEDIS